MHHGSKHKSTIYVNKTFMQIRHRPRASHKLPAQPWVLQKLRTGVTFCHSSILLMQLNSSLRCTGTYNPMAHRNQILFLEIRYSAQNEMQSRFQNVYYHTKNQALPFWKVGNYTSTSLHSSFYKAAQIFLHRSTLMFFFLRTSKESTKYFKRKITRNPYNQEGLQLPIC